MFFGQCHLSIVPVRAEHADESEIVTQLLFGEVFVILQEYQQWRKIKTAHDDYEGWIDQKQMIKIDEENFNHLLEHNNAFSFACSEEVFSETRHLNIVKGSTLPNYNPASNSFKLGNETYKLESLPILQQNYDPERLVEIALSYLETPYLWGGRSPFGIDCSGFTQMVFKFFGIQLPRDASQQVTKGKKVDPLYIKQGDLAFFVNKNGKIHHVGLMISDSEIIHAAGKVRIDTLDEEGIYNEYLGRHSHKLHSLKRFAS